MDAKGTRLVLLDASYDLEASSGQRRHPKIVGFTNQRFFVACRHGFERFDDLDLQVVGQRAYARVVDGWQGSHE
ncbi:MAG: hypothetical protein ABI461_22150 [Polyangiaceae bacterium]